MKDAISYFSQQIYALRGQRFNQQIDALRRRKFRESFFVLPSFQKNNSESKYWHGLLHGTLIKSHYDLTTLN